MAQNEQKKKIAFPRIAGYNCAIKYVVENGLGQEYIMQPEMTKRTLEIGSRYSPDMVCAPFKTSLGSMIEALDAGADTLLMTFGLCRLGYYGELQEQIIRDLGYEFEFVNLSEYHTGKKKDYLHALKRLSPDYKPVKLTASVWDALKMVEYVDEIEADYYKICGFEVVKGSCKNVYRKFMLGMETAHSRSDIDAAYRQAKQELAQIELDKPKNPIRVGIIGEYFTVMDAFSNLELEQKLADMRVEVHRWMNLTNRNIRYSGEKNLNARIRDLCKYEMGPTSTANIWCAREYAEKGFDGIIHVKSAGCTPEIDVMPVLQNIGAQYKIPILYLTYDSQTSDTGLMTRLEAFYDMLEMNVAVQRRLVMD
jgi:predicted nucleotide-binding protein (sugar kinase/HSP70/actin superfamily)